MGHHAVTRIVWICVAIILVYAAFFIWTDAQDNLATLRAFPWEKLPLILGAVLMNFVFRELKWEYFRRAAGIRAPRMGSFMVFFSGFSMSISPARAGELIKPFMYKTYFGHKMTKTVPLVFCERLSDALGMLLLAALTLSWYLGEVAGVKPVEGSWEDYSVAMHAFLIISVAVILLGLILARNKRLVYGILRRLSRFKKLQKLVSKLRHLYFSTYTLLTVKNILVTTLLAAFSWSFECYALDVILAGVDAESVSLGSSAFIFCMATLVGGFLFFLPGGVGGFDGAYAVLLGLLGLTKNQIVPSMFIFRLCTLFFSVALGFVFVVITGIRYGRKFQWSALDEDIPPTA